MSKAIRGYMAETITAFQLDRSLFMIADATQDGTVKVVGKQMWFHCDNCKYHKIVASKQTWNYFNRLLLLLESDAEAEFVRTRTSWRAAWHIFFQAEEPSFTELASLPFPSISSLLWLRRKVKVFSRCQYPSGIAKRRIRSVFLEKLLYIPWIVPMLILSPVVLLYRILRCIHLEPRITMPQGSKGQ
jgi:hypothetical protein